MDGQKPEAVDEQPRAETPEDVAVLYSWANLQGARYRDFSGSRRESRAQMRHRAAQEAREAEIRAQSAAEAAAAAAERAAREAEEIARLHEKAARRAAEARQKRDLEMEEGARALAMRQATELSRKAAGERVQAARRAEAAAAADATTRREEREIAEAHIAADLQTLRYEEAETRRRALAGPQPVHTLPGEISDPYVPEPPQTPGRILPLVMPEEDMRPSRFRHTRDARQGLPPVGAAQLRDDSAESVADAFATMGSHGSAAAAQPRPVESSGPWAASEVDLTKTDVQEPLKPGAGETDAMTEGLLPAWFAGAGMRAAASPAEDTLQQSRERVAARWFALRGLFDQGPQEQVPEMHANRTGEVPVLAVFSLAGGVGKTSLVATLGRALAASGEKVLLTDTTSHGLLPFYFGASELRPGAVRTFAPPMGSSDAPVHLLSFDLRATGGDLEAQESLAEDLTRNSQGMQRVLVDLSPSVPWVAKRLARMNTLIVVPMAPDMSSIISLSAVERFFADITDAGGRPVHPYYLLNGFDASQPLHLDVREVLRQQLGERLLPFVIRRSSSISEALAEGMTVMDYAPEAAVADDFMNLASWLRKQSAPAPGLRKARWSEQ